MRLAAKMGKSTFTFRPERGLLGIRKELDYMQIFVRLQRLIDLVDASPLKEESLKV